MFISCYDVKIFAMLKKTDCYRIILDCIVDFRFCQNTSGYLRGKKYQKAANKHIKAG
jgi:hypothetical protein